MKRNRRLLPAFLSVVVLLLANLLVPPSASASSTYDTTVNTTAELHARGKSGTTINWDSGNIASTWFAYATDPTHGCSSTITDDFEQALSDGDWAIFQFHQYYKDEVKIVWIHDTTHPAFFSTDVNDNKWLNVTFTGMMILDRDGSNIRCTISMYPEEDPGTVPISSSLRESANLTEEVYLSTYAVTYPSGYEGKLVPDEPAPAAYVAMGDSFSSGEGNSPFEEDTNVSGVNECHRSLLAYPRRLQYYSSLDLGPTAFVACSGATTHSVLYGNSGTGNWNEGPQVDVLSVDTRVVTITIGGNDIGFKQYATACVVANCSSSSDEYQNAWSIMTDSNNEDYLPDKLASTYAAIADGLTAGNTTAKVYVVGYPLVVTLDAYTDAVNNNSTNCLYMTGASATAAEAVVNKLNEVISDAVAAFNDSRFVYIDLTDISNPFEGHEICTDDSYFNGVSLPAAYTFHPNAEGQAAYQQILTNALSE